LTSWPDDLKAAVEREALRRNLSDAEVIRQAIAQALSRLAGLAASTSMGPFVDKISYKS
jgi:predicted transcriptional regulator